MRRDLCAVSILKQILIKTIKQMRTKEEIIQAYAMGLLTPGELVSQLKPYYNKLNPFQIINTINTILK
tara:strand:- start:379 stop:582 length:204 start_codon:yes stop_codon:yes gene_type:complete